MPAPSSISIYLSRRKEHASTIFNLNLSQPQKGACQHHLESQSIAAGAKSMPAPFQSQSIAAGERSMPAPSSISIYRSRSKEHASTILNLILSQQEQGACQYHLQSQSSAAGARSMPAPFKSQYISQPEKGACQHYLKSHLSQPEKGACQHHLQS